MTGNVNVIAAINTALASESRAAAQYRQDAAVLANMNLEALAKYFSDFAGQEDEHRNEWLARITFLDGEPAFQPDATEYRGDVRSILTGNLALELKARNDYQALVDMAAAAHDSVTRGLAEDTEGDEEKHINFLEGEIDLLEKLEEADYVAAWKART